MSRDTSVSCVETVPRFIMDEGSALNVPVEIRTKMYVCRSSRDLVLKRDFRKDVSVCRKI